MNTSYSYEYNNDSEITIRIGRTPQSCLPLRKEVLYENREHARPTPMGAMVSAYSLFDSCLIAWLMPVAARPEATPTAAAVIGSFAGNSGVPM